MIYSLRVCWSRLQIRPLFEMLSKKSMLNNNLFAVNNIKYSRPVEIHHMWDLGQLNKGVSYIDEILNMLNRKQISLCKLNHKKYFGLSLIEIIYSLWFNHPRWLEWFEKIATFYDYLQYVIINKLYGCEYKNVERKQNILSLFVESCESGLEAGNHHKTS